MALDLEFHGFVGHVELDLYDLSEVDNPVEGLVFGSVVDAAEVAVEVRVETDGFAVLEGVLIVQCGFA